MAPQAHFPISLGQIRWVNVVNGVEDRHAQGKFRPALVVEACDGHCETVGFTTHGFTVGRAYERPALPNPLALGLSGPGFLWSDRPVKVSRLDVGNLAGWADDDLIELVLRTVILTTPHRLGLRRYQVNLTRRASVAPAPLPSESRR
jgi:hypothetical protein